MRLEEILETRIAVLDGAMGTMIQTYQLDELGYRGREFANHHKDLKGCNDLLSITQPGIIETIHRQNLDAGADIIETNTFNSTAISMADYKLEHLVYDLNLAGAKVARRAVEMVTAKDPTRPRFVAGAIGPTNRTASMSPDVNDPAFRAVTYDELVESYYEQVRGLMDGGVDLLLAETVFDTLNLKAALFGIDKFFEDHGRRVPVMVSVTITDQSGRTLSGQTIEAFWNSVAHMPLLSVGINCALGAKQIPSERRRPLSLRRGIDNSTCMMVLRGSRISCDIPGKYSCPIKMRTRKGRTIRWSSDDLRGARFSRG